MTDTSLVRAFLIDLGIEDQPWREKAACRGLSPELFYVEKGENLKVKAAREVCAMCPVREECGEYGIAHETVNNDTRFQGGIWGGLSFQQRLRIRRSRKRAAERGYAPCGTRAAYQRHVEAGEKPCAACREANGNVRRASEIRVAEANVTEFGLACGKALGTEYGRKLHGAVGEKTCEECRIGTNTRRRQQGGAA